MEDVCWICLEAGSEARPLHKPCSCPRWSHRECIARWQLQSAGTIREKQCEFCAMPLPDWRTTLTPPLPAAPAIMTVKFHGTTHKFEVRGGAHGYRDFVARVKRAFELSNDMDLNLAFSCDCPYTGATIVLNGAAAYDAAVHCAVVSAAKHGAQRSTPAASTAALCGSNMRRYGATDSLFCGGYDEIYGEMPDDVSDDDADVFDDELARIYRDFCSNAFVQQIQRFVCGLRALVQ